MKKDKLQEYADKSLAKYDSTEIRERVVSQPVDGRERVIDNTKRNWIITVTGIVFVIIIVLSSYLIYIASHKEKVYLLENRTSKKIAFEELNIMSENVTVNPDLINVIKRVDDTNYSETLYYDITFTEETTSEKLNVIIVSNADFNYELVHNQYNLYATDMNMNYVEQFREEDGIYLFNSQGEIEVGNILIYIQYEGFSVGPQSNFCNFLRKCISVSS